MGKVLIIDDEKTITGFLAISVQRLGHSAVTAHSAQEARDALEKNDIDLVIADIILPDVNDAQEWISEICRITAPRPVALISGAPTEELNSFAKEQGVVAFLSKPFELAFIKNVIKLIDTDSPA